jgi:hypothetical protein
LLPFEEALRVSCEFEKPNPFIHIGLVCGPVLGALKLLNGEMIHLPTRAKDRPDRDRLALRFERFKPAA